MNYIFLNLKRFDIPTACGGVNSIAPASEWAEHIIRAIKDDLDALAEHTEFAIFFPEAHIIPAAKAKNSSWKLGCQGVYRDDVSKGGNFGAFTTGRTAKSMKALGCEYTIIGHCEERKDISSIIAAGNGNCPEAVNEILNKEVLQAQAAGLKVLFCVGEKTEEVGQRREVIRSQLIEGLKGVDLSNVVIGYEPLWAIGPGRPVPTAEDIREVTLLCKSIADCPVVYGGGLKEENAQMLASIGEMDGGLIALTRFKDDIGFYPEEYLRIIHKYLNKRAHLARA